MRSQNLSTIPSFLSHAQMLIPIMHNYFSDDPHKKIALSTSLLAHKPIIILAQEPAEECITLEDFFVMLDARLSKEFAYREEIIQLKNTLYCEFNNLCDCTIDQDYSKLIRDQRQAIINAVFDETKIDDKMVVEKFFNDMTNGFEEEALKLNNFSNIVHVVIGKPLLTPFPVGILSEMKKLTAEMGNGKSFQQVQTISSILIEHIKKNMEIIQIKESDFNSEEKMKLKLEELSKNRKICSIKIESLVRNTNIINDFRAKCIHEVEIETTSKSFLEKEIKFVYEKLILKEKISADEIDSFLNKIQRGIIMLVVGFAIKQKMSFKTFALNLSQLTNLTMLNLDLSECCIGDEEANTISNSLAGLTNIFTLDLNLRHNQFGMEGIKTLSAGLKELKKISNFALNLSENKIGNKGVDVLLLALKELAKISTLRLYLWENDIDNDGAKAIATALRELKNIIILTLDLKNNKIEYKGTKALSSTFKLSKNMIDFDFNFGSNKCGKKGIKGLSIALAELNGISSLTLSLWGNNLKDEGVTLISNSLKVLKNLSTLALDFRKNYFTEQGLEAILCALKDQDYILSLRLELGLNDIGNKGAIRISDALKILKNISFLELNFTESNISDEGAVALSISLKTLTKISHLALNFGDNKIGDEGAIALSESFEKLANVSTILLNLWANKIEDRGVLEIVKNLKKLNHILALSLDLWWNEIGEKGIEELKALKIECPQFSISY